VIFTFVGYYNAEVMEGDFWRNKTTAIRAVRSILINAMSIIQDSNTRYKNHQIIIDLKDNVSGNLLPDYDSDSPNLLKMRIDGVLTDIGGK